MRRRPCMTDDEFAGWVSLNVWLPSASPCSDCTTGFAEQMRAVGMCDGEPQGGGRQLVLDAPTPRIARLRAQGRERARRYRAARKAAA